MSVVCWQFTNEMFAELLAVMSYEPILTGFPAEPMVEYVLCAVNVQPVTHTLAQREMAMNPLYGAPWSPSPVTRWRMPSIRTFDLVTAKPRA